MNNENWEKEQQTDWPLATAHCRYDNEVGKLIDSIGKFY